MEGSKLLSFFSSSLYKGIYCGSVGFFKVLLWSLPYCFICSIEWMRTRHMFARSPRARDNIQKNSRTTIAMSIASQVKGLCRLFNINRDGKRNLVVYLGNWPYSMLFHVCQDVTHCVALLVTNYYIFNITLKFVVKKLLLYSRMLGNIGNIIFNASALTAGR